MNIKLLHNSPLWLASNAIRMSHDNHDKSDTKFNTSYSSNGYKETIGIIGEKDKELIYRIGNKFKHKSVLEQLVYWFDIDGISRACLQELARHRTARLTVKSSRYTLKQLKYAPIIDVEQGFNTKNIKIAQDFLVWSGEVAVDYCSMKSLFLLQQILSTGTSNDIAKYCLPEAFKTRLQWQIDGRNLQNFLELRTSKDALWEIRELANNIYRAIPEDHKYLYKEYVKEL